MNKKSDTQWGRNAITGYLSMGKFNCLALGDNLGDTI